MGCLRIGILGRDDWGVMGNDVLHHGVNHHFDDGLDIFAALRGGGLRDASASSPKWLDEIDAADVRRELQIVVRGRVIFDRIGGREREGDVLFLLCCRHYSSCFGGDQFGHRVGDQGSHLRRDMGGGRGNLLGEVCVGFGGLNSGCHNRGGTAFIGHHKVLYKKQDFLGLLLHGSAHRFGHAVAILARP